MPSLACLHTPSLATHPIPSSYIAKSWRGTGFRVLVDEEIEHSKLHQSTEAEDEADGNIEIQRCNIGHTWEILPGIGTQ